jgi:MFS transporter, DHA2 family, multidrug resistance protein
MVSVVTLWKMPNIKPAVSKVGLDLPGMLLLSVSLSTFALVVSQASLWGYASATTLVLVAVFFLLLILFCLVESKSSHPLVDFNLFKTKNFLNANLIGILLYVCLSSWIICSGLYFSQALHYKAFYVGLTYLPFGVSLFVVNLFVPRLNQHFSTRVLLLLAAVIAFIGFIVMAGAIYNALGIIVYSFGTLLFGVGYVVINSLSVQLGLAFFSDKKINIASGLSMMLRWVGAAIGPPVLTTVFTAIAATSGFSLALSQCYLILSIIMMLLTLTVFLSKK